MTDYKVIKGRFHVRRYSPDGDSIRFSADNEENWEFFTWKSTKERDKEKKQLRLEAIDALETHYEECSQPHAFAIAALESLLSIVGITHIEYNIAVTKIINAKDDKPGYIVASTVDTFSRPVCFAFGDINVLSDGQVIQADDIPLERSINYIVARDGLAYPTYYEGIEDSIREKFTDLVVDARMNRRGIWALDRTHGFKLWNKDTIQYDVIVMPKIFRRIISFYQNRTNHDELMDFLKDNPDPVKKISDGTSTKLHKLIENDGRFYKLTVRPEMLLFAPK